MMGRDRASRIVVDEGVSDEALGRFEAFARAQGIWSSQCVLVREQHPGMPDGQIVSHLLDQSCIFVTTDRPLHNRVLAKRYRSYYLDGGGITGKPLPGIHQKRHEQHRETPQPIQESYQPPTSDLHPLLMPDATSKLKRLRTKRRRIRNHFGGLQQLDQVTVTVSWRAMGADTLIGVRLRISSTVGIKALDASEAYFLESASPEHRGNAALCHAFVLCLQLMLQSVRTVIYFDVHAIEDPSTAADSDAPYLTLLRRLMPLFGKLTFTPTTKGPLLDRLRAKLDTLAGNRNSNEIVPGELQTVLRRFEERQGER
jgi:hypothetical protein